MTKQRNHKRPTKKKLWVHRGGGTLLVGSDPYPSDDEYRKKNGGSLMVECSVSAHFNMPKSVESVTDLISMPGVKQVTEYDGNDYKLKVHKGLKP